MNNQHSDFITRTRNASKAFISAVDQLRALDKERVALDLGNQLNDGTRDAEDDDATRYGDFAGTNNNLTTADINGVFTTLANIETMMNAGNATNLYKVK